MRFSKLSYPGENGFSRGALLDRDAAIEFKLIERGGQYAQCAVRGAHVVIEGPIFAGALHTAFNVSCCSCEWVMFDQPHPVQTSPLDFGVTCRHVREGGTLFPGTGRERHDNDYPFGH